MPRPGEIVKVVLTYEDYCQLPNDGRRYEILDGEIAVTPAPSPTHQEVLFNLARLVDDHVRSHGLGKVYVAPIDVILAPTSIVQPDMIYVAAERLSLISTRGIEGPPDLAVEVLSPTTSAQDRGTKLQLYARYGIRHCWLIDPDSQRLEAYELAGTPYRLVAEPSGLAEFAPALFPDLRIRLDSLWPR
ncbi:MAG: Uma2 family endonuclease [Candidatus Methylomirabilia bacterium]